MYRTKALWITVVVAAIVAVVGIVLFISAPWNSHEASSVDQPVEQGVQAASTRTAAPDGVAVPQQNEVNVPADVAVPAVVAPATVNGSSKYRGFAIAIRNGQFTPDTVIVNAGDQVSLALTAVDGDYDFTQPDYFGSHPVAIPKGTTKQIAFQVSASGKFEFYCTACGGPAKGPVGFLIVEP